MQTYLHHKGFSCWVTSDSVELPVYHILKDGAVQTGWIASTAGQKFSVSWQDDSGDHIATSGHVFIDGKDVASAIIRPGRGNPVERSGAKQKGKKVKPFIFSKISLTDDDSIAKPRDKSLSEVGSIKLTISRVRLGRRVPFEGYEAKNLGIVHETSKKAGTHCVEFGSVHSENNARTVAISTEPYDDENPGPFVTFIFYYRTKEILQAEGRLKQGTKRPAPSDDEIVDISSDTEIPSQTGQTQRNESPHKRKRIDETQGEQVAAGEEVRYESDVHEKSSQMTSQSDDGQTVVGDGE